MNFKDKKELKSYFSFVVGAGMVYLLFFKLFLHVPFLFPDIPEGLKLVLIAGSIGISWAIFKGLTEKLLNLMYPPKRE